MTPAAQDAALAAFAASKPGRLPLPQEAELDLLRRDNDRLSEALKELAVELSLQPGKTALGLLGPVGERVSASDKLEVLGLVDQALAAGWAHTRACAVLQVADVRVHRQRARLRATGTLEDRAPGGNPVHCILPWEEQAILGWGALPAAVRIAGAERVRSGALAALERLGDAPERYAVSSPGPERIRIANRVQAGTVGARFALERRWDRRLSP